MEITQGVRFDSLGLSPELMRALEKKGYVESTPIQAGCIPPMMDWQDVPDPASPSPPAVPSVRRWTRSRRRSRQ